MKKKGLRIVRDKRPTKLIVHDANDVIRSGNSPSSMGLCVDEPRDRWMDDMYEAVDY